jgi:hypothetical protein
VWRNSLLATGYRITPRRLMVQIAERLMKAN